MLVENTHYCERASSFASEIIERQPHIVCMQEVYDYRVLILNDVEFGVACIFPMNLGVKK